MEKAVIFDLDDTIADISRFDGVIYDRKKYPESANKFLGFARPIPETISFLKECAKKYKILFVTARPEETRKLTQEWIRKNVAIPSYTLLMRANGDNRSSDVVKGQLYKLSIEPQYDVQFAVDDMPENRQMFKNLGIPAVDPKDIVNLSKK